MILLSGGSMPPLFCLCSLMAFLRPPYAHTYHLLSFLGWTVPGSLERFTLGWRTAPPSNTNRKGYTLLENTLSIADHHPPNFYAPAPCNGSFRRGLFVCQGTTACKPSTGRYSAFTPARMEGNTFPVLMAFYGPSMGFYGHQGKTKRPHSPWRGCSTPTMASGRPLAHLCVWHQVQTENLQRLLVWLPSIPLG